MQPGRHQCDAENVALAGSLTRALLTLASLDSVSSKEREHQTGRLDHDVTSERDARHVQRRADLGYAATEARVLACHGGV